MPWEVTSVMERRIKFVLQAILRETNFSQLCLDFGISRSTGYRWLWRYYKTGSVGSLMDRSRRPHHSPNKISSEIEQRVLDERGRYHWGARKLRELLLRQGVDVKAVTINRILKRHGLITEKQRGYTASRRFERANPNELWQMDFKGEFAMMLGKCYPLTIVDDHSRFGLGIFALAHPQGKLVQKCLIETFDRYGLPEAMLMDHGAPWWSTTNGYGLTTLSVWLIKQNIRLLWSGIGHPQTQGKVERFHRTLKEDMGYLPKPKSLHDWQKVFDQFLHRYNYIRPHEALAMGVPADYYNPSCRPYRAESTFWDYPDGAIIKRLNPQGCLYYKGRYYFVCEALGHEWIRIEKLPKRLLISYRNMYIREIELDTKRTKPLVIPVSKTQQVSHMS